MIIKKGIIFDLPLYSLSFNFAYLSTLSFYLVVIKRYNCTNYFCSLEILETKSLNADK